MKPQIPLLLAALLSACSDPDVMLEDASGAIVIDETCPEYAQLGIISALKWWCDVNGLVCRGYRIGRVHDWHYGSFKCYGDPYKVESGSYRIGICNDDMMCKLWVGGRTQEQVFYCAAHEFGHGIGLDHADDDIMSTPVRKGKLCIGPKSAGDLCRDLACTPDELGNRCVDE